jgi:hypothetical protein
MNGIHISRPGVTTDGTARKSTRGMMAWTSRCLWLAVRPVIGAIRMAHHEQVRMWECVLATSGVEPLTEAGPLRWVRTIDGYRLEGSDLQAPDQAGTAR